MSKLYDQDGYFVADAPVNLPADCEVLVYGKRLYAWDHLNQAFRQTNPVRVDREGRVERTRRFIESDEGGWPTAFFIVAVLAVLIYAVLK